MNEHELPSLLPSTNARITSSVNNRVNPHPSCIENPPPDSTLVLELDPISTGCSPSRTGAGVIDSDVFVPQLWTSRDELAHECSALGVIDDIELDAAGPHVLLRPLEGPVLADHDARDTI